MSRLSKYKKKKEFLVCVDSDGCAMDTMDIKHFRCFGPCMVEEWGLKQWEQEILERWNEINLYTMTRGINRFKGLSMALQEIDRQYRPIEDLDTLVQWAQTSPELSNANIFIFFPIPPLILFALPYEFFPESLPDTFSLLPVFQPNPNRLLFSYNPILCSNPC